MNKEKKLEKFVQELILLILINQNMLNYILIGILIKVLMNISKVSKKAFIKYSIVI